MGEDSLADFLGQIKPFTAVFQKFDHAEALLVVAEAFGQQVVQCAFPDVAVGRVAQVMPEGDGFGQVFVKTQGTGQRTGNLGHLERVGQPGAVMIPLGGKKHLRFEFQAPEGFAVDDPVPVTLVFCPQVTGRHRFIAAGGFGRTGGPRRKQCFFLLFLPFTDRHRKAPFLHIRTHVQTHSNNTTKTAEFLP